MSAIDRDGFAYGRDEIGSKMSLIELDRDLAIRVKEGNYFDWEAVAFFAYRQPKYDAFVDAVRDHPGQWPACVKQALAALDREDI